MNRKERRRTDRLTRPVPGRGPSRLTVEAMAHHQAGRLEEARTTYLRALAAAPDEAEILHLLGVVACQLGDGASGLSYLSRAVALRPTFADAHCNLGQALLDAGRWKEALAAFDGALAARPDFGEAHDKRGLALQRLDRPTEAVEAHREACRLLPRSAVARSNLGGACLALERYEEAEAVCRKALLLAPMMADAHVNLGLALGKLGRLAEAEAALRRAAGLAPHGDAHYNLGCVLLDANRPVEAVAVLQTAIAVRPDFAAAHNNLGTALRQDNRVGEAEATFRQALALDPASAEAHFNLALALLVGGDLSAGWPEYEWRWRMKAVHTVGIPRARPRWSGGRLDGRTILLHAEQGLGDTIQFLRYVPRVAALGGRVVLEVQPELVPLLAGFPGVAQVVARGERCDCDCHCPLLSLAGVFATTLETIPAPIPYIMPDPRRAEAWVARLAPWPRPRVGLVWAGSPDNRNDRNRSLPFNHLDALLAVPGPTWLSLQKGREAPAGSKMVDLAPDLTDFAETAAALAHVDLVVTVDTSVAHLAGAIGVPTWILLPHAPDWRWLLAREDTPWYPSARLFRQRTPGDWTGVIDRVVAEVAANFGIGTSVGVLERTGCL